VHASCAGFDDEDADLPTDYVCSACVPEILRKAKRLKTEVFRLKNLLKKKPTAALATRTPEKLTVTLATQTDGISQVPLVTCQPGFSLFKQPAVADMKMLDVMVKGNANVIALWDLTELSGFFSLRKVALEVLRKIGEKISKKVKIYANGHGAANHVALSVCDFVVSPHVLECAILPLFDACFEMVGGPVHHVYSDGVPPPKAKDIDLRCGSLIRFEAHDFADVRKLFPLALFPRNELRSQGFMPRHNVGDNKPMGSSNAERVRISELVSAKFGWNSATPVGCDSSVLRRSRVWASAETPFVIECMHSGKIVVQFMVQRWDRANGDEIFMPRNTQCK
jgi:hypothetical protein